MRKLHRPGGSGPSKRRRLFRRGTVLPITLLLCVLAALSTIWMVQTLADQRRLNERRRDLARAYFAAQGGVAQVLQWGNYPSEYDGEEAEAPADGLFYRKSDGTFPNLGSAFTAANEVAVSTGKLGAFASKYEYEVGKVKSLKLLKPQAGDPVASLFKVESVGETPSGRTRTVLAYIAANPVSVSEIALQAGLISIATAAQFGNGKVHWGEAWSKQNFNVLNMSQCGYLDKTSGSFDPWAKYRTEGQLIFPSTWKSGAGKDIYQETTRRYPGLAPASGNFEGGLEQFIPPGVLQWPDLLSQYDTFKAQAKSHGRYYGTDAAGNIYREGVADAAHLVDFDAEFGDANRDTSPYDLVFIDTTDRTPPKPDGSNLATISNSGTGLGMKGVFWVGANYKQTGSGNPASLDAERPDTEIRNIPKVYLDGVFYTAGTMDIGGNPIVYGSMVAERGYIGGGTPEIYFNYKLKDGLELPRGNVGSVFTVRQQKNY